MPASSEMGHLVHYASGIEQALTLTPLVKALGAGVGCCPGVWYRRVAVGVVCVCMCACVHAHARTMRTRQMMQYQGGAGGVCATPLPYGPVY